MWKMFNAHLCLNVFALLVGVCHITVILVYFFGCVGEGKATYISDILNDNKLYMNLMTFFVLLQLTACYGFVRVHARSSNVTRVLVESMFLAVSWIGWCILILQYKAHGGVSRLHFLGVGLFVSGGVVYFAFLIWEMYASNQAEDAGGVLIFLYCASVALGFLFILGFFCGWGSAWIFEHAAFIVFSLAHNYLFYVDVREEVGDLGSGIFDSLRIECVKF
jgi:hypothetical protein